MKEILKDMRKHLMTGVSYMIPFVVAGGILLALSVVLYGEPGEPPAGTFLGDMFSIGVAGFSLMTVFLGGYIAYSMVGRTGIAPAAIGSLVAVNVGAGFLGALAAGILGGIVVYYLKEYVVSKLPKSVASLGPIMIIPVVGTFIVAGAMQWVIGIPISWAMEEMTDFLNGLSGGSIVILALVIGFMEAFDLGGPVNKTAYMFVIASISAGAYHIGAISSVGVSVAPIGMGLATVIGRDKWSSAEKDTGKAAIAMGCVGISEGAIPFVAANPGRVMPATIGGTMVGTAIMAILGGENMVAWGGLIVIPGFVSGWYNYLIALAAGSIVTALIANALHREGDSEDLELDFEI